MKVLLTHNIREYVDVLSIIASEVHVADNGNRVTNSFDSPNIYLFQFPIHRGKLAIIFLLSKYLKDNKIDVIYAQGSKDLIIYAFACRLLKNKCKIIVTSHSSYTWQTPWNPPIMLCLFRLLANAVIFLSGSHYSRWHSYCNKIRLKSFHVGNPVDINRFIQNKKVKLNDIWNIGYVGVFREQKGQLILLEAVRLLKQKGIAINLHFAGDYIDKDYHNRFQKEVRQKNLESVVRLYGRISYDSVPQFLSGLDLYVCPSFMEMMPFNVLEAMASGLPVVATSVGGIPDAIRDGHEGFLVSPNNAKELAENILKAMNPDVYPNLALNSYNRAKIQFSFPVIAKQLKYIIENI